MKILFVVCTHGNETLGLRALDKIKQREEIDFIIANPEALGKFQRFIDCDLNRSFGSKKPWKHEECLAWDLLDRFKNYDVIVDIHSTTAPTEKMAIVNKETPEVKAILECLQFKNIVYFKKGIADGAMTNHFNGLALEYPADADLNEVISDVITISHEDLSRKKRKANKFEVFDVIKNFNLQEIDYIPLFIGEVNYKNMVGFKARRI